MEWISVKDSLPKNLEYVLATDLSDVYILKFNQSQDKRLKNPSYYFENDDCDSYFDYIHFWMPLPNIPEKK